MRQRYVASLGSIRREGTPRELRNALTACWAGFEVKCRRCETAASIPLNATRRPRDTTICKLEGSFRCRSRGTRRYRPPVHMLKLTETREIAPYIWTHPDDDDRR